MSKQHEIRNYVEWGRSKGTQCELGNRKNKKSLPLPQPPPLLSLLIGYIKFLFPK